MSSERRMVMKPSPEKDKSRRDSSSIFLMDLPCELVRDDIIDLCRFSSDVCAESLPGPPLSKPVISKSTWIKHREPALLGNPWSTGQLNVDLHVARDGFILSKQDSGGDLMSDVRHSQEVLDAFRNGSPQFKTIPCVLKEFRLQESRFFTSEDTNFNPLLLKLRKLAFSIDPRYKVVRYKIFVLGPMSNSSNAGDVGPLPCGCHRVLICGVDQNYSTVHDCFETVSVKLAPRRTLNGQSSNFNGFERTVRLGDAEQIVLDPARYSIGFANGPGLCDVFSVLSLLCCCSKGTVGFVGTAEETQTSDSILNRERRVSKIYKSFKMFEVLCENDVYAKFKCDVSTLPDAGIPCTNFHGNMLEDCLTWKIAEKQKMPSVQVVDYSKLFYSEKVAIYALARTKAGHSVNQITVLVGKGEIQGKDVTQTPATELSIDNSYCNVYVLFVEPKVFDLSYPGIAPLDFNRKRFKTMKDTVNQNVLWRCDLLRPWLYEKH